MAQKTTDNRLWPPSLYVVSEDLNRIVSESVAEMLSVRLAVPSER